MKETEARPSHQFHHRRMTSLLREQREHINKYSWIKLSIFHWNENIVMKQVLKETKNLYSRKTVYEQIIIHLVPS